MSVLDRPYAGTWTPNRRSVVQFTPDALVYLNGDTSLPGCRACHHNIDIQKFITSISVDAGVEPGASTANFSLTVPRSYGDSLFRDGNCLLRPGLEVHIYARGFFPLKGMVETRVGEINLGDVPQHPYYPLFHGVVTEVSNEDGSGAYTFSLTCAGMLHFWQHIKFSTSGSYFGARPVNSNVRTTLTGHPLTGRSPHSIIYTLYRDTAGSAAGVGFALSSRSNYGAVSSVTRDSLYSMTIRYWERRFRGNMYGLRMHGASGQMFSASQQAYVSLHHGNSGGGHSSVASHSSPTARPSGDPLANDPVRLLNLRDMSPDGRVLRQVDLNLLPSLNGGAMGLSMEQMQPFAWDLGAQGQANLFESTYESKLDIATAVTNITGFEFYQDVDGDLVFKPPLYNLDTSSSRVYRIEPEDIISISLREGEPEATYVVVKGGAFQNMQGVVSESEWGCRSTYIDYKGVAQFGWREASLESTYYSNAKSAFFLGVAHLDKINVGVNSCSVTIPIRPEIRPGFPVYVPHLDCHYYVQSVSHAIQFGGSCTTTLSLVARRRKFIPPGVPNVTGGGDLPGVDLSRTDLSPLPLRALDYNGVPRLVGMPNVVMALDPTAINPMFSHIGFQAEEATLTRGSRGRRTVNRQLFLTNFIQVLWERGVLGQPGTPRTGSSSTQSGLWYRGNPNEEWGVAVGDHFTTYTVSYADLRTALDSYISLRDDSRSAIARLRRQRDEAARQDPPDAARIDRLSGQIETLEANLNGGGGLGFQGAESDLYAQAEQVSRTEAILRETGVGGPRPDTTLGPARSTGADLNASDRVVLLAFLIRQMQTRQSAAASRDLDLDPTGTINSTANLLELLNDRKASMSVNTPGQYRYYSASHPDPAQQGYAPLDTTAEAGSETPGEGETRGSAEVPRTSSSPAPTVTGEQPARRTRMTPVEAVRYLSSAYAQLTGHPPSDRVLGVLLGQWGLESGTGTRMYNFNYGGVKIPRRGWEGGRVRLATHETIRGQRVNTEAWFQAYGTPEEGAIHYLRNILDNYGEALAAVDRSGNPEDYGRHMGRYHTGDNSEYAAGIARIATRHSPTWIRQAREQGPGTPEATPAPAPRTVPVPETDYTTTVLRRASDIAGLPPETAAQYVTPGTHIPSQGLEVRTFTSNRPRAVPTSHIRTLTFEARTTTRVTRGSMTVFRPGETPSTLVSFLQSCLAGNPTLSNCLAREMADRAGTRMTDVTGTPAALVAAAVPSEARLRGPSGPLNTTNISDGRPNPAASPAPAVVGTPQVARTILANKARALLSEVTAGNREALLAAVQTLRNLPPTHHSVPPEVVRQLSVWRTSLGSLFARGMPTSLPFRTETGAREITGRTESFSPVFPVSDERGYEHYGAFQYGRGLTIEPGGNYARLMASDPLRYADPQHVEALVTSLIRHPGEGLSNPEADSALRAIAGDIQSGPGERVVQEALQFGENAGTSTAGDRTAMLVSGLRNYIMSNRDAVTKLPASNTAYGLAELSPQGQDEVCDCRGAEADLLLAAYMSGANEQTFVGVDSPQDTASQWLQGQIRAAGAPWSLAQEAVRGRAAEPLSPGGSLNSLEGLRGVLSGVSTLNDSLAQRLESDVNDGVDRLGRGDPFKT